MDVSSKGKGGSAAGIENNFSRGNSIVGGEGNGAFQIILIVAICAAVLFFVTKGNK